MKIVALVARILLGLIFVVFGLNGLLKFIPGSDMVPPGVAGQFVTAMGQTQYLHVVSLLQVLGGALVLSGFFVPLGLVVLGPILFNILCFHVFFLHGAGAVPGVVSTILWFVVFIRYRENFAGIFAMKTL